MRCRRSTSAATPTAGAARTAAVEDGAPRAGELLQGVPYVRKLEVLEPGALRLYVDEGATAIPQILRALVTSGIDFGKLELERPSLDDVFLTKTGRSLRES